MRRVTRESSWGKLINKQVTRWVGSRQIDMRAHSTQNTRTEATCSRKTKTRAHGQQTILKPCAKHDTNTQLMRKLISHVFTQDMTTRKHATNEIHKPIETRTACNTTKHTWTGNAQSSELETAHSHNDRKRSASVRTPLRISSPAALTTTEVRPLSKAPNCQLLPGRCSIGCPLLQVCVHLDGFNAENTFHCWLYSV